VYELKYPEENYFFHFFEQRGEPFSKKTKKTFFSKMTIDTPIESLCRVHSKFVITKNIFSGFWSKSLKNFIKIRHFWSFSSILFMVAIYAGVTISSMLIYIKENTIAFKLANNKKIWMFGSRDISYSKYSILGHKVVLTH
jgi:hypothetical protein